MEDNEMIDQDLDQDIDQDLTPEEQEALAAEAVIAGSSREAEMDESEDEISELEAALEETGEDLAEAKKDLDDFIKPNDMSQLDFSDVEDDVNCTVDLEIRKRVVEAVLFVSDKPVGMTTFLAAFGEDEVVKKQHINEALEAFEEELEQHNRGFRLHQVDGGYQLRTAEDLKEYLQNTIKARSFRLTGPSLETLAMVAYKQPCPKSSIDEIRGVDSSHLIRALMDRNLLSFAGKSELPGKPMLYKTTSKFLEVFGLRSIKELPSLSEIEALLPNGIGDEDEEEKETLSDLAGKMGEEFEGSYSASEEELGKINEQLSGISTETEFFEQEKQREKDRKELEKAENLREALMVGEEISTRDQNWLVRFDEKMSALAEESEGSSEDLTDEAIEEAELLAEMNASSDSSDESEDENEEDSDDKLQMSADALAEAEERAAEAIIAKKKNEEDSLALEDEDGDDETLSASASSDEEPFSDFLDGDDSEQEPEEPLV